MQSPLDHVESPPPPFLTAGVATADVGGGEKPSSSGISSIAIVIIIIASAVLLSASFYLLLCCLTRRRRSLHTFPAADDAVYPSQHDRCFHDPRPYSANLVDSLPVFAFRSLSGNIVGADCAVCLSKFESNDQLRLLPLCCHAFHAQCIDAWLESNQTCPLCRSTVHPTEADVLNKILGSSAAEDRGSSFRIEIGSLSGRRGAQESGIDRRSYSIGSFEYTVEDGYEVPVASTHRRVVSDFTNLDKESTRVPATVPVPASSPVERSLATAADVGGRSWLRDYMESISSRTFSIRGSGRFFTGSSRRSDVVVPVDDDLEPNRIGEEISELFRWLSGV